MKNQQALKKQQRSFGAVLGNQNNHPNYAPGLSSKPSFFSDNSQPELCKSQSEKTMDVEEEIVDRCQSEGYETEINNFIFSKSSVSYSEYFQRQPEISSHMRGVLINWLINVHLKYELSAETLYLCADIIDQFLEKQIIFKKQLQLTGITALWIASKFHDVYQVPKMSNLVHISDNAYTPKQILSMEERIMNAIQFNLLGNNLMTYMQLIGRTGVFDEKDQSFARYFSQITLIDWTVRTYDQKMLAAGIIYLIKRMKKQLPLWSEKLHQLTGITEANAKTAAKDVYLVLCNVQANSQCFSSLRCKYSIAKYHEVGRIVIKHKSL